MTLRLLVNVVIAILAVIPSVAIWLLTSGRSVASAETPKRYRWASLLFLVAGTSLLCPPTWIVATAYHRGGAAFVPLLGGLLGVFLALGALPLGVRDPQLVSADASSPEAWLRARFGETLAASVSMLVSISRIAIVSCVMAAWLSAATTAMGLSPRIGALAYLGLIPLFFTSARSGPWTLVGLSACSFFLALVIFFAVANGLDSNARPLAEWLALFQRPGLSPTVWIDSSTMSDWNLACLGAILTTGFLTSDATCWSAIGAVFQTKRPLLTIGAIGPLSVSLLGLGWVAGVLLIGFYAQHPDAIRPLWVVNIDPRTREFIPTESASGRNSLNWNRVSDDVTIENLDRLIVEGRILRPNRGDAVTDREEVLNESTGVIDPTRIATFRPGAQRIKEAIFHKRADVELWPFLLQRFSNVGLPGLWTALCLTAVLGLACWGAERPGAKFEIVWIACLAALCAWEIVPSWFLLRISALAILGPIVVRFVGAWRSTANSATAGVGLIVGTVAGAASLLLAFNRSLYDLEGIGFVGAFVLGVVVSVSIGFFLPERGEAPPALLVWAPRSRSAKSATLPDRVVVPDEEVSFESARPTAATSD